MGEQAVAAETRLPSPPTPVGGSLLLTLLVGYGAIWGALTGAAWLEAKAAEGVWIPIGSSPTVLFVSVLGAQYLIFAVIGGTWLVWTYRAYDIAAIGKYRMYMAQWWVVVAWLPVLFLFRPYQVLSAIDDRLSLNGVEDDAIPSWLMPLWWASFMVMHFAQATVTTGLVLVDSPTGGQQLAFSNSATSAVVVGVVTMVAVAFSIATVARLSRRLDLAIGRTVDRRFAPRRVIARIATTILLGVGVALAVVFGWPGESVAGEELGVDNVEPGTCFIETDDVETFREIDCSAPHAGQVLGFVRITDRYYPKYGRIKEYGTVPCRGMLETVREGAIEYKATAVPPTEVQWAGGVRRLMCVVSAVDGNWTRGSFEGQTGRVPLGDMTPGCYASDLGATALPAPCGAGAEVVTGVVINDMNVSKRFPGHTALDRIAESQCPPQTESWSTPSEEWWVLGDRVTICFGSHRDDWSITASTPRG